MRSEFSESERFLTDTKDHEPRFTACEECGEPFDPVDIEATDWPELCNCCYRQMQAESGEIGEIT